jgi:uncharacterized membrane protein YidH (DUF202 family)
MSSTPVGSISPPGATGSHGSVLSLSTTGIYTIIVGALVLVGGLAWQAAFQAVFDTYLHEGNAVLAKFIYAIVITIIIVIIVIVLAKFLHQQAKFS